MRKSRRVLAATLAAMMFLTPVNVDAMWMQSPTIQKDNKVTYNTHYTIELKAVPYTDDTFSEKVSAGNGTEVTGFSQVVQKSYSCTTGEKANAGFDINADEILNYIKEFAGGEEYTLGELSVDKLINLTDNSDFWSGTDVTLDGDIVRLSNVRGYDDDYNANNSYYTDYTDNLTLTVTIPFYVKNYKIDSEYKGTFNHGYIPSTSITKKLGVYHSFYQTFSIPTVNVKDNPSKIPLLIVEAGEDSSKTELIWLETKYIGTGHLGYVNIDTKEGLSDDIDMNDFDSNPNPYIEREFTCDSRQLEVLRQFNKSAYNVETVANPNATGDYSDIPAVKVTGSDPVEIQGQGSDEILYTKFNVKIKAGVQNAFHSYEDALQSTGSFWSEAFGMTWGYYYIIQNSDYKKITDYYNVYDGDRENAEFVKSISDDSETAPATEAEGYAYAGNYDVEVVQRTNSTDHTKIYRYFNKMVDKTVSYKLKYKAVYADGSPAEGISLKGEVTGPDGYIEGTDVYSITCKNMIQQQDGSYKTDHLKVWNGEDTYELNPLGEENVINIEGNEKEYAVKSVWNNLRQDTQIIDKDGKPDTFSHSFTLNERYSDAEITAGEDEFTKVFVLNVGEKQETREIDIPVKINYYSLINGQHTCVLSDDASVKATVKYSGDNRTETPDMLSLNDYDISEGMERAAAELGVDVDSLVFNSLINGNMYNLAVTGIDIKSETDDSHRILNTSVNIVDSSKFDMLMDGYWCVNVIFNVDYRAKVTVHYQDENGNKLSDDAVIELSNNDDGAKTFVKKIDGYTPAGRIEGDVTYPVVIRDADSRGDMTEDVSPQLVRSAELTSFSNDEITVIYDKKPLYTDVRNMKTESIVGVTFKLKIPGVTTVKNVKCKWKSSDTKILTVDSDGKIKTKKSGKAKITLTTSKMVKVVITVTVKPAPKKITLNKSKITLKKGKSTKLTYSITKKTYTNVTFSSSNKKVVSVNKYGKIKALKKGTATITAKTANGKRATCKVTVK